MAKVRNSAHTMRSGRIGENTWYVRNGEQIVRQRLQNSNYGEGARRSEAQQLRRAKWGNLVNFYKAIKSWQPKAYEGLKPGQTDYNMFMSLNANSTPIYLTKQLVEAGGAVVGAFQLSKGSLSSLRGYKSPISLGIAFDTASEEVVASDMTVGKMTDILKTDHPDMADGDNLALIAFYNRADSAGVPRCHCSYREVTLNSSSSVTLASLGITGTKQAASAPLILDFGSVGNDYPTAYAAIFTKQEGGSLKVSTESIVIFTNTLTQQYSTPAAAAAAVASYGVDADVPLMPGE